MKPSDLISLRYTHSPQSTVHSPQSTVCLSQFQIQHVLPSRITLINQSADGPVQILASERNPIIIQSFNVTVFTGLSYAVVHSNVFIIGNCTATICSRLYRTPCLRNRRNRVARIMSSIIRIYRRILFFFPMARQPLGGLGLLIFRGFAMKL